MWRLASGNTPVVPKGPLTIEELHPYEFSEEEAFIAAASRGDVDEVQKGLEDSKLNPDMRDGHGNTALIHASRKGHTKIVDMLLADKRVTPNAPNKKGLTAMMAAAAWGNYDIGNKLFAAECDMEGYTIAGQPTGIADGLDDEWLHAPWDPND